MKIKSRQRIITTLLIITCVILGSLIGSGIALADEIFYYLEIGWNDIYGTQDEWTGSTGWSYDVHCREWMNYTQTRVDFDYIHYYNGSSDATYPTYLDTYVYDKYGYDVQYYFTFNAYRIDGINRTCDPLVDFTMDELSSSNNLVFVQQLVSYLGFTFSDYVITFAQY